MKNVLRPLKTTNLLSVFNYSDTIETESITNCRRLLRKLIEDEVRGILLENKSFVLHSSLKFSFQAKTEQECELLLRLGLLHANLPDKSFFKESDGTLIRPWIFYANYDLELLWCSYWTVLNIEPPVLEIMLIEKSKREEELYNKRQLAKELEHRQKERKRKLVFSEEQNDRNPAKRHRKEFIQDEKSDSNLAENSTTVLDENINYKTLTKRRSFRWEDIDDYNKENISEATKNLLLRDDSLPDLEDKRFGGGKYEEACKNWQKKIKQKQQVK